MIVLQAHEQGSPESEPFHRWSLADGSPWLDFYRSDTGYVLRFPGLADFTVSRDGTQISCTPAPGVTRTTYEHLFVNQVLPLARSRSGELVFHASAVEVQGSAIAFFGRSGMGKSTLAASFATNGSPFLTDDGLFVQHQGGTYVVTPSAPTIRLWEDSEDQLTKGFKAAEAVSYTAKRKFVGGVDLPHCVDARKLLAGYFLGEGTSSVVRIEPIAATEAMMNWVKQSFLLDVDDRKLIEGHFHKVADIVGVVPSFIVDYPRVYDRLPEVRSAIISHVRRTRAENES